MSTTQTSKAPPSGADPGTLVAIPIGNLRSSPTNPRKTFVQAELDDLVASVKAQGILQPLLVRGLRGNVDATVFEIVFGERRYRAAAAAGLELVPCHVRQMSDAEVLEAQVVENLQREDLHALEEAEGFRSLIGAGLSAARIAERVGTSENAVYDRLQLLKLSPASKKAFREGLFESSHAVLLSRLSVEDQARALDPDNDALLEHEGGSLLDVLDGKRRSLKAHTVREFSAWIDEHVRFNPARQVDAPRLFPKTTEVLATARQAAEKVISITHEHYIQPEARDGKERTFGPRSWKRADGSRGAKVCDRSVTGVVVVGEERGQAFKVCTDKECSTHWAKERRERAAATKRDKGSAEAAQRRQEAQERRYRLEERRAELERKRIRQATPALLAALRPIVAKMGPASLIRALVSGWGLRGDGRLGAIPTTSLEAFVRWGALSLAADQAGQWDASKFRGWAERTFPGFKPTPIVDQAAPLPRCGKCGCTELRACKKDGEPCSWKVAPDAKTGVGTCSTCAAKAEAAADNAVLAKSKAARKGFRKIAATVKGSAPRKARKK